MANDFTAAMTDAFRYDPAGDIRNVQGAPGWFELSTPEPAQAAAFLAPLFGWEIGAIEVAGAEYLEIRLKGHAIGGIRRPMPGEPAEPRWTTYLTAGDVETIADRAESLGAQVFLPPMALGNEGRMTGVVHPAAGALMAFEYATPLR